MLYAIYRTLMKYEDFNILFQSKVNSLPREKQVDLAISVCKRLFPDYQQFHFENNWGNTDTLLDSIKICELNKANEINVQSVKDMLPNVNKIIPDTEDFENSSYALNASSAVYETLEFILDNDTKHLVNIGTYLTDTVDFKIQEEAELTQQQIDSHPKMVEARKYLLED